MAGFVYCRFSFLEDAIYNVDEAEYATSASALQAGWLPGVDLLGSTKPPGISLLYLVLFEAFGRSLTVLHIAHLILAIISGLVVVEIAYAAFGTLATLPAALSYVALANSFATPAETLALNVETPGMLCALLAILVSMQRASTVATLSAGLLLGVGTLFRQSILFFVLPLWFVGMNPSSKWRRFTYLATGFLSVWLILTGIYAMHHGLGWAVDSWLRYPAAYASDLGLSGFVQACYLSNLEFFQQAAFALLLTGIGFATLFVSGRHLDRRWLLLWIVASFLALASGSRFYPHYYYQLYPVLALLAASAWVWATERRFWTQSILALLFLGSLATAALHFPHWYERNPWHPPRGVSYFRLTEQQLEQPVGDYLREHSSPQDRITVWGYCPQIYWYADRLPGTRDFLCHYVTGYSPQSFDPLTERAPRPFGHPDAERMFLADLVERKPRFIVDLTRISDYEFPFVRYSLLDYPLLRDYISANYRPDHNISDALIYRHVDAPTQSD